MEIRTLFYILLAGAAVAVFLHHNRLNQAARRAALSYCEQQGLQMLDQTAVLRGLRWHRECGWALERRYSFEFSVIGGRRYQGWVVMVGDKTLRIETQPIPEDEFKS